MAAHSRRLSLTRTLPLHHLRLTSRREGDKEGDDNGDQEHESGEKVGPGPPRHDEPPLEGV